jgi:DNA-binding MarR family transcriptional regulator
MNQSNFEAEVATLMHAVGLLTRRVRAAVSSHDLSLSQTMVMARIGNEGPAAASDLARAEGIKPQSMGTILSELEELGLIAREPHPTDGRQKVVNLTAKGLAVRKAASAEKRTWLSQAIAQLDKGEQKTLLAAGEIMKRLVENDGGGTRGP